KRQSELQQHGLVSELDALRGRRQAEERQSQARAAESAAQRVMKDLDAKEQDRLGQIAHLKNEIAEIEGGRNEAVAASERLDYQIDQRQGRAPISGTLAEVAPLKIGGMVQPGDRICTIVPDGGLKVVAQFRPSVAGRIRHGQFARVRLEGFPWTQYGSAAATVANVSGEVRDGQVRVDLALDKSSDPSIPFQHGLPAEVQVEIERISPIALVLRSVGEQLGVRPPSGDLRSPGVPLARRRFVVAEVIQTSAIDCGPASLKALLDGFYIPTSYGRLREACQTDVDGTSIDTIEVVAEQLGLDAQQILVPLDHVLLTEATTLPAIAVVRGVN